MRKLEVDSSSARSAAARLHSKLDHLSVLDVDTHFNDPSLSLSSGTDLIAKSRLAQSLPPSLIVTRNAPSLVKPESEEQSESGTGMVNSTGGGGKSKAGGTGGASAKAIKGSLPSLFS